MAPRLMSNPEFCGERELQLRAIVGCRLALERMVTEPSLAPIVCNLVHPETALARRP